MYCFLACLLFVLDRLGRLSPSSLVASFVIIAMGVALAVVAARRLSRLQYDYLGTWYVCTVLVHSTFIVQYDR